MWPDTLMPLVTSSVELFGTSASPSGWTTFSVDTTFPLDGSTARRVPAWGALTQRRFCPLSYARMWGSPPIDHVAVRSSVAASKRSTSPARWAATKIETPEPPAPADEVPLEPQAAEVTTNPQSA